MSEKVKQVHSVNNEFRYISINIELVKVLCSEKDWEGMSYDSRMIF